MKSVLIICQHFIPYTPSLGGVVRAITLAKFLKSKGWSVFVLTSDGVNFGYLGFDNIVNEIKITYLSDPIKRKVQQAVKTQLQPKNSNKEHLRTKALRYIKKVLMEIVTPDLGVFMVNKYTSSAMQLIKKNDIQNVIITTPPHSMQLVGKRLKKEYGNKINLVADYRDSWNTSTIFKKNNYISDKISKTMELSVLKYCDYLTFVSAPILEKLEKLYKINLKEKSILVMNGYSDEPSNKDISKNIQLTDTIKIGYFGYISDDNASYRSIRNILDVLEEHPDCCRDISFEFYGQAKLQKYNKKIHHQIKLHDNLPYHMAQTRMKEMDYLMLVHSDKTNCDEVITGKFFEYLAIKKPILCFAPNTMEASRLIKQNKIGIVIDINDKNDILDKLKNIKQLKDHEYYKDIDISVYKREKQYEKILDILKT